MLSYSYLNMMERVVAVLPEEALPRETDTGTAFAQEHAVIARTCVATVIFGTKRLGYLGIEISILLLHTL